MNIWSSDFWKYISSTVSRAQLYSWKEFRVPWQIYVWRSGDLKATILVALHIPIMLLWGQIHFPGWDQGCSGHMRERGVSIQLCEFLIHRFPTKASANSGEKAVWLEVMLLIKTMKHTACEKQPAAAVVLGTPSAPAQPRSRRRRCHSPSAWRRRRKEAIRADAFPAWSPGLSRTRKSFRDMAEHSSWPQSAQAACHSGVPWHIPPQRDGAGWGRAWLRGVHSLKYPDYNCKKLEDAHSLRRPDSQTAQDRHFFTHHQLQIHRQQQSILVLLIWSLATI